jgi:hypothetical protein
VLKLLTSLFASRRKIDEEAVAWPPLPEEGFITGRAATPEDVEAGRAVFALGDGESIIGNPIDITIPQYVWQRDGRRRSPGILVQAEETKGHRIVGVRLLNGEDVAGLLRDLELLGAEPPRPPE